jgi:predicted amidohydrolase
MSARVALIQMTSHFDPLVNADTIDAALGTARAEGAVVALLPEMAILLDKDRNRSAPHVAMEVQSPLLDRLRTLAARHGLWLHSGSAPYVAESDPSRRVNRSHMIDPSGAIVARYDKIHLFDVDVPGGESWRESAAYRHGDAITVVDTPAGRIGMSICFDMRFAELYRALAAEACDIIAVPAAFTVPTGQAHWHVLLRARAIETQTYVLAAAQVGAHADGRRTYGHSLAVDPWGGVLADAGEAGPCVHIATIDAEAITKARTAIPMASNRRL